MKQPESTYPEFFVAKTNNDNISYYNRIKDGTRTEIVIVGETHVGVEQKRFIHNPDFTGYDILEISEKEFLRTLSIVKEQIK